MEIIALQLDLGRQKERLDFIESFADNAAKHGYNTLLLYLECSVRTSVTPFFDEDDTYSLNELKEIVNLIEAKGLSAIPAFENFAHIEKLLCYDEAKKFSEFDDERIEGRGWASDRFKRGSVGCTTNPEFNEFFDKYISEVCSVFRSEYVHMGLDEIFEFAECPRCLELRKKGVTKKDIFFAQVMHNHALVKSMGKTMLMWDDFFEYYDIVRDLPRDIILCHWNYGFIGSETKGHWTNRVRKDWLSLYDELGFNYIFCAYGSNASSTYNVDTLTAYALKHKPFGAILTMWERSDCFYNGAYPLIALCGELWSGKIKTFEDKVRVYTEVLGNKDIAETLLKTHALTSCLAGTCAGDRAEDDNFVKLLYRNSLSGFAEKLRSFLNECDLSDASRDILSDIYDFVLEKSLIFELNALGPKTFDEYEKENLKTSAANFDDIYAALDKISAGFNEINENCLKLWQTYRSGIKSSGDMMEQTINRRKNLAESVKRSIEANKNCGILYLDLIMADGFGSPRIKLIIKYAGEDECVLFNGSLKSELVTFDAGGAYTVRFAIKNTPVEYVELQCFGEDSIFVSNMRCLTSGRKYYAAEAKTTCGKVIDEQNVTVPDTTFARLGYDSGIEHLNDLSLAKKISGIRVKFDKIV